MNTIRLLTLYCSIFLFAINTQALEPVTSLPINEAKQACNEVNRTFNYLSAINKSEIVSLPFGVDKQIGSTRYTIVVNEISFGSQGATLAACITAQIPGGDTMVFSGTAILKPSEVTNAVLELRNPNVEVQLGLENKIIINGASIEFNSEGFKDFTLNGNAQLNSMFATTQGSTVTIPFTTPKFTSFEEIVCSLNTIPEFKITAMNNFTFNASNATLDLSLNSTPDNVPVKYLPANLTGENKKEWRGIYIESCNLNMPSVFNNNGYAVSVSATDLIIDENNISGFFTAGSLVPSGKMGTWNYTIDSANIELNKGSIAYGKFKGKIELPLIESAKSKPIELAISFDTNGNLTFGANFGKDNMFNFKALEFVTMAIFENSTLEISIENNSFKPKATLQGWLNIKNDDVVIPEIVFSNLVITDQPFTLNMGGLKLRNNKPYSLKGYPITIDKFIFEAKDNKVSLEAFLSMAIGSSEKSFAAKCGFVIASNITESNGSIKVHSLGFTLKKIAMDIDMDVVKVKGDLELYNNDETYGTGLSGRVNATFKPGITAAATAIFGEVDNYRYWFVDAMVTFPAAIALCPALGIYGFGGGAYYHMTRSGVEPDLSNATSLANDTRGQSASGIVYTPDRNVAVGLKAAVELGTLTDRKIFNGNGTIQLEFNTSGGLKNMDIYTNAYIMTEVYERNNATAKALGRGSFSFNDNTYRFTLNVNVKAYNIITASGTMDMFFSKDNWHIFIGEPALAKRIKVDVVNLVKVDAYFNVGTDIKGFIPYSEIIPNYNGSSVNAPSRDGNILKTGRGFALGGSFSMSTGDKEFGCFYGKFDATAGFDLMLCNFGGTTTCKGETRPIGFGGGWYASGQAYGFADGEIGIKARLFGEDRRFTILDLMVYAALQAQLPNPSYFKGEVGGKYSVAGGLVSGDCKFQLVLGEQCEFAGTEEVVVEGVIEKVSIANDEKNVSLTPEFGITFNKPVNTEIQVSKDVKVKFINDSIYITNPEGISIWHGNHSGGTNFSASSLNKILAPNTTYTIHLSVKAVEIRNNVQKDIVDNNGRIIIETKTVSFTTTNQSKTINQNTSSVFPVNGMANVYLAETPMGYINLKVDQDGLIEVNTWARFTSSNGVSQLIKPTYSSANKQISFDLSSLQLGTLYKLELVDLLNNGEYVWYTSFFGTSSFQTFNQKMSVIKPIAYNVMVNGNSVGVSVLLNGTEYFDKFEKDSLTITLESADAYYPNAIGSIPVLITKFNAPLVENTLWHLGKYTYGADFYKVNILTQPEAGTTEYVPINSPCGYNLIFKIGETDKYINSMPF